MKKMKNNLSIFFALAALFIFSSACRQTADVDGGNASVAASNTDSTVGMNQMNTKLMKGSIKESSPDAASAPFDLQFLDTMIEHHQGAVDMAKPVAAKSDNAALKAFAAKIITEQNKEIAQMKAWREKWFAGKPAAINMEMPGMADSMKGMKMKKLEAQGGKLFDLRFLDMMTPHHQGAVAMAQEALTSAEHSELKTLANQIIDSQEAEIGKMQEWKTAWSK